MTTPEALAVSSICAGEVAPTIALATFGWRRHPGERELRQREAELRGDRTQALDAREHLLGQERLHEARLERMRRARAFGPCAGAVLPGEHALRERAPHDLADAELRAGAQHALSIPRRSIEYCGWLEIGR